jgi:hypothetical protein
MYKLEELKNNIPLLNAVEWDLNPAVAVGRHLEWGAGWACDNYTARGSVDESVYFAISTWERPVTVVLVKRKGFEMEELASFSLPKQIEERFLNSVGHKNGLFELDTEVKQWLKGELNVH